MAEYPARRARSIGWFTLLVIAAGAIGGLIWHAVVSLPTYSISDNGAAQITERALGQVFATDGMFVLIGLPAGLMIGFAAWRLFGGIGWRVALVAALGGLVAAGVCWLVGVAQGPRNFSERITAAHPGQLVPVDFQLHTWPALFVWALGAIIPVMLYANLSREPGQPPRRSRSAAGQVREDRTDEAREIVGGQLD